MKSPFQYYTQAIATFPRQNGNNSLLNEASKEFKFRRQRLVQAMHTRKNRSGTKQINGRQESHAREKKTSSRDEHSTKPAPTAVHSGVKQMITGSKEKEHMRRGKRERKERELSDETNYIGPHTGQKQGLLVNVLQCICTLESVPYKNLILSLRLL